MEILARLLYLDDYGVLVATPRNPAGMPKGTLRDDGTIKVKLTKLGTDAVRPFIGLDCRLTVRTRPYRFVSKCAHNYGTEVSGLTITMVDVAPAY